MSLTLSVLILLVLIVSSAVVSASEISIAGARKVKLQQRANDGDLRALSVLQLHDQPGRFITIVQILSNMVAILGGIVGEAALRPIIADWLSRHTDAPWASSAASFGSFIGVTSLFIVLSDLMPKRLAMTYPEAIAIRTVRIMQFMSFVFMPLVWLFENIADTLFKLLKISTVRQESMTFEDIYSVVDAGAEAGVLKAQEHYLIENIFDMQTRTVTSTMTTREYIIFFNRTDSRSTILNTLYENPHENLLICDGSLEKILGYAESHTLLSHFLKTEGDVSLTDTRILRKALFVPDTLSLFEVLEQFKLAGEDFAIIVNEYALVVGVITLKDVMSIVMGELVSSEEEQIVRRDEDSWLIDGATPLEDVMRTLSINHFPQSENYETIAGFMMFSLRKIPKKTDFVLHDQYKFEIIDTDNFKIDQLLVSRRTDKATSGAS